MDTYGWVQQALEATEGANFQYAKHAAHRALQSAKTDDQEMEANYAVGYVFYILGQFEQAQEYLQKTILAKEEAEIIDRRRLDAVLLVAESLRQTNHTEESWNWLEHGGELLMFGVLPDYYQGLVARGKAHCLKSFDIEQARTHAAVALQFFPDDENMIDLLDSRDWEPFAWQIFENEEWSNIEQIDWGNREGQRVKEYLIALNGGQQLAIDVARRKLTDSWWRQQAWWRAACSKKEQPGVALEILYELEQEHHLDSEWEALVRHYKAELLLGIDPEKALLLVQDDQSENGQLLAIAAAEKAGKKITAAKIKRQRGDWGAGARDLLEEAYGELDALVGLDAVKATVKDWCDLVEVSRMRGDKPIAGHVVMTGNPGTGKTTVANIWSKLLWALGLSEEIKTTVVSRGDLVGEYVGHTAPKVKEVWHQAKGGVLFIDEAYALAGDNFGAEAIATLLELMENHREEVSVVIAGYASEIPQLWQTNPGFRSRFTRHLDFPDYNGQQLAEIAMRIFAKKNLRLQAEAAQNLAKVLGNLPHDKNWANAREIRNWIDILLVVQARRVIKEQSDPALVTISDCNQSIKEWWQSRGL